MADVSPILGAVYRGDRDALGQLLARDPELDVFEAAALGREERVQELVITRPGLVEARRLASDPGEVQRPDGRF
jgi:hypothetical protein